MAKQKNKPVKFDKNRNSWYYSLYLGKNPTTGKKIIEFRRFKSEEEALKSYYRRKYEIEQNPLEASKFLTASANQMTLREFYENRFLPSWRAAPSTLDNMSYIVKYRYRDLIDRNLNEITKDDIHTWLNSFKSEICSTTKKHYKPNYINKCLGHLYFVLKKAVDEGLIDENPCKGVERCEKDHQEADFWTYDEFLLVMREFDKDGVSFLFKRLASISYSRQVFVLEN